MNNLFSNFPFFNHGYLITYIPCKGKGAGETWRDGIEDMEGFRVSFDEKIHDEWPVFE